jgi:3-oxoacyl-[acyl-carrier protein] reductase
MVGNETQMRTALITGGSRGIGLAISERLAKDGFEVIVVFRERHEAAQKALESICGSGGKCTLVQTDVSDKVQVRELFRLVRAQHGRLDVLVNNAGRSDEGAFMLTSYERFLAQIHANFLSAVLCSQAALRLMASRRSGSIINISSSAAIRSPAGASAYAASKAALNSLTRTMAREVASLGIRVNGIAPSWTDTEMIASQKARIEELIKNTMLGRLVTAEEIAAIVSALVRDDMTAVSGQTLQFEGGI